jgi:hypothetical protein
LYVTQFLRITTGGGGRVYNLPHRRRGSGMNPDLEEVGTLVSAGLAAHEVDAVSFPARRDTETHANCLNCGAALGGAHCSRCGQAAHLHRSLLHLSEEFLHGMLHFDVKGYPTVRLLFFRPGLLTRRYIEGQRTRYVSPMALFLFCIFLAYFVFSLVGGPKSSMVNVKVEDAAAAKANVDQSFIEAEANLAQASKDLEAARKAGVGVEAAESAFAAATLAQKIVKLSSEAANRALKASAPPAAPAALTSAAGLPSVVAPGVMIVPPVHMFMQLRETYALSIFSALWRTLALLSICGTAFLLFLALVVVMVIH